MGQPNAETVKIHEYVMAAQKAGIQAMRAGKVTGAEVNRAAHDCMEQVVMVEILSTVSDTVLAKMFMSVHS